MRYPERAALRDAAVDPLKERRKREAYEHWLDELEAVLTGREKRKD